MIKKSDLREKVKSCLSIWDEQDCEDALVDTVQSLIIEERQAAVQAYIDLKNSVIAKNDGGYILKSD